MGSCCRCIGCFCTLVFILVLTELCVSTYMYYTIDPKPPTYHLETLDVKSFNLTGSFLATNIHVAITAQNANKYMIFHYSDVEFRVEYSDVTICTGKVPGFIQERRENMTLTADLTGTSNLGTNLDKLVADEKSGKIPLTVKMNAPIRVSFVGISKNFRFYKVSFNSSVVVDGLSAGKASQIISSKETMLTVDA